MVNNYRKGPKGKRYAKRTTEVKRKMAAYKKKNKRPVRNAMRPFVETKFREVDRASSHHIIYSNTTGVASVAPDAQMSINALNVGTGTNHAVPQDFTCVVPQAWSDVFQQGSARDQINGRCIYPTYLNCKCELDWSAFTKDPSHENVIGLDDTWMCIKGWAKNSLIKQVQDESSLPATSSAVNIAMAQIVGKCAQQSGVNGDRLAFPSKKKDLWIQSHFPVRSNLNQRYQDVTTASPGNLTATTTFGLPKVLNFSWTIKRKQLLRKQPSGPGAAPFMLADSWVPFVAFYNRNLSNKAHTHTPDLHSSSKLYFTDQ